MLHDVVPSQSTRLTLSLLLLPRTRSSQLNWKATLLVLRGWQVYIRVWYIPALCYSWDIWTNITRFLIVVGPPS